MLLQVALTATHAASQAAPAAAAQAAATLPPLLHDGGAHYQSSLLEELHREAGMAAGGQVPFRHRSSVAFQLKAGRLIQGVGAPARRQGRAALSRVCFTQRCHCVKKMALEARQIDGISLHVTCNLEERGFGD